MDYTIGADLGTSALKLLLVDGSGQMVRSVTRTYSVFFPRPGWSEQDPADWWAAFVDGIRTLCAGIDPAHIAGIGLGGQMHGLVALDKYDAVIRPAILWNDGRTAKQTDYLNNVIGKETLSFETSNIAFAGFTAPKLLWLRENEPENFRRICKIMLPKDYINYRLTGVHASDYSDASGTLLLNVQKKCWSQKMLDLCGIPDTAMPQLFESYEKIGGLLPSAADMLGLLSGTPVVAGAGDNAAAAVGTGTVSHGRCNISLGTSGTVFLCTDTLTPDPSNALHAFCHADGGYHRMGCMLSAASCNKWFCTDILKTDDFAAEQAAILSDMLGKNRVFFLPYLMGERSPINDTDATGVFIGIRMDTSRSDLVQAVLEGVAFAIRDNTEAAKALGQSIISSSLCGGGARSPLWRKILCNVLNIPLQIPQSEEGPGYGAAMLAMVGIGAYPTVTACAKALVKTRKMITPDPAAAMRYEEQYCKFQSIYPSVKQVFQKIQ